VLNLKKAAWFLKVRAMISKSYIDDAEMEEQAIGDILMDNNQTADNPRFDLFSFLIVV
jgi:hypothetical protein